MDKLPSWFYLIIYTVIALIPLAMAFIAGIGLLFLKAWARRLNVVVIPMYLLIDLCLIIFLFKDVFSSFGLIILFVLLIAGFLVYYFNRPSVKRLFH